MKMIEDREHRLVNFLLIDDDSMDREGVKRALKKLEYINPVTEANNGEEGLNSLQIYENSFYYSP